MSKRKEKINRCRKRVRAKISGTSKVPRFCVFRSGKHIYAQLIDDERGKVLVSASDLEIKKSKARTFVSAKTSTAKQKPKISKKNEIYDSLAGKIALAFETGKLIAKKSLDKKVEKVVFDRGGRKYHGRIKALADGAREGGLKF
jgi:large subunit ribosomal protein L18